MDPKTGFVKAWVGGPNFNYFALDHVKKTQRQVGSTIKPFVYAAAMGIGVIDPCKSYADISYCIDVPVSPTRNKAWCPATGTKNTGDLIYAVKVIIETGGAPEIFNDLIYISKKKDKGLIF